MLKLFLYNIPGSVKIHNKNNADVINPVANTKNINRYEIVSCS